LLGAHPRAHTGGMSNRAWILTVLVVAGAALAPRSAGALCATRALEAEAWPRGTLQPDGVILVTLDSVDDDPGGLSQAVNTSAVVLEDQKGRGIPIDADRTTAGISRTQLLVRPRQPLKPGTTVTLVVAHQTFQWQVAPRRTSAIRWTGSASVIDTRVFDGCPYSSSVTLDVPLEHDVGEAVLVGILARGANGSTLVDYEPLAERSVSLAYSGCSGGVRLHEDVAYEAELVAIDSHGQRVAMPGRLTAKGPGRAELADSERRARELLWRERFADPAGPVASSPPAPSTAPAARPVATFVWYGAVLVALGLMLGTSRLVRRALRRPRR
jgi:hypothetical protein